MDTFEVLIRAGLDKKSAAVLAALLDKGMMSISQLSQETHINRPALYVLLPRLQSDGLVSQVRKQKRVVYKAESPSRLLEKYAADHREVSERLVALGHEHEKGHHDKPVIKYFEGQKGVTFVYDDVAHTLPKGGVFYRYSARTIGGDDAFKNTYYAKIRDKQGIERMVITSEDRARQKTKKLERAVKSIPKDFDLFEDNIALIIYADKTAYIDYASKTAFIIESPKIARFQEKLFRLLYKKL
jgi:DNA-binding transcriptional ArsR family regulator